ncbi:MAG: hypothetical protein AB7N71_09010 [Phycisphaerae bacterium]
MRKYALEQYVERSAEQLKQYFEGPTTAVGDAALRNMIHLGVDRAKKHDIIGECNVVLYTSLMLLFGSYFDEDGQYAWAAKTLADKSLKDEAARAETLYDRGVAFFQRVAGDRAEELAKSLVRTRKILTEELAGEPETPIRNQIARICPPKSNEIGEAGMETVLRNGREIAKEYEMSGRREQTIITCLAYGLGAGFHRDPLHPWAAEALQAPDASAKDRGTELFASACAYGDRWMTFLRSKKGMADV